MICLLLINEDQEVIHHLNSNRICHEETLPHFVLRTVAFIRTFVWDIWLHFINSKVI